MAKFMVNREFIPVSVYFIENCLKDANGVFIKVYLYALSLAVNGREADCASVAKELDLLESDVLQAFSYWKNAGMIIEEGGVIEFVPKPGDLSEDVPAAPLAPSGRRAYDAVDIAKNISKDQNLSELILVAQDLLAKPLTTSELESLYWFYDELKFSTEAILLLLDYCVSRDKKNMRYIEKVAVSWHEKGIISPEAILAYMKDEEEKNGEENKIKKALGISDRPLSKAEEQFLAKWMRSLGFSSDMIIHAYELCILNTAKLSFPYMDKIIERWNSENIRTKAQALADDRSRKGGAGFDPYSDKFDHSSLEQLTRNEGEEQ